MKPLLLFLSALLILTPSGSTSAQSVRTLAVADFTDETHNGFSIRATQMNAELERILNARGGGRLRVVPTDQVRAAMRSQGVTADNLISPTKAIAVAQAVGAEWIVTGRWTRLEAEWDPEPPRMVEATAVLEIRVLEAGTRRVVLQETFFSWNGGIFPGAALRQVAQRALLQAADRILRLGGSPVSWGPPPSRP